MSGTTGGAVNIEFLNYPTSNRTHGVFAEVNNTLANTGQYIQQPIIVAQMLGTGTTAPGFPFIYENDVDLYDRVGASSIAARMVQKYRARDDDFQPWVLPIADASDATSATGTVAVSGTATANGTLCVYIGEDEYFCGVSSGDAAAAVATRLAALVNADPQALATGAATTGTVTFTIDNKGTIGNTIFLGVNQQKGEATPAGLTVTVTGFAGGATDPTVSAALANLGDVPFDFIVSSFSDTTNLNAFSTFLNDSTGRWSWQQELFGHVFYATQGSLGTVQTFGTGRNNQHETCIANNGSITPPFLWAADLGGVCAKSLRIDPAIPLQELVLDVMPPAVSNRWGIATRNTLLYTGISTFVVNDAGQVITDRIITTYQINTAGAPDNSYLDVETMYTLMAGIRDMRIFLQSQFPRKKLVSDTTRISAGSNMVTSKTVLASAVARYRTQCANGLMQNPDQFAQQAKSQNKGNGLVALLLPMQLANQLRQIAMLVQFQKP